MTIRTYPKLARVVTHPFVFASLAALLVSLIALALTTLVAWWPARAQHAEAERHAITLMAELKDLKVRQDMAVLYRSRLAQVEILEKKLQLARSEPDFVAEIEKLAATSQAELLQFSSRSAPKDKVSADTTIFEFFLKGDYAALKTFIAGVRDLPEFVTIERVVLERIEPSVRLRVLMKRRTARRA